MWSSAISHTPVPPQPTHPPRPRTEYYYRCPRKLRREPFFTWTSITVSCWTLFTVCRAAWHAVKYFLRWPQISAEVGQFPPPAPSVSTNFRGWDNVTIFHGIINIDYRWYLWSVHYTFFHRSPPAISLPLALVLLIRMGCWLSYFLPSCVTQLIGSGTDNFCSEEHLVKRSHSYAFSGPGNIWRLHLNKIQYRQ